MPTDAHPTHDATTGFHDIKAPPGFHPALLSSSAQTILALLAAAALVLLLLRRMRRRAAPAAPERTLDERLADGFRELERAWGAREIDLRAVAAGVSALLRMFLEETFGFPAEKQAPREVLAVLRDVLKSRLRGANPEQRVELDRKFTELLRACERWTFAPEDSNPDLPTVFRDARGAISELAQIKKREDERVKTVVAHAPSGRSSV